MTAKMRALEKKQARRKARLEARTPKKKRRRKKKDE